MKPIVILAPDLIRSYTPSTKGDRFIFADRSTPLAKIDSPVPEPFGHRWKVLLNIQRQKSDRSEYPISLRLKLFPPDSEGVPAVFEREVVKSRFAWSDRPALTFFAFPVQERQNLWVFYSFYPEK